MNKAILIGRLTRDPELRTTPTGRNVCQFSVAVSRTFTNANGEREADFINCVVWDKQAENLVKYQKKGNQIAVEGRIQTRNYDDPNVPNRKVYVTEVVVDSVTFLESKSTSDARQNGSASEPYYADDNYDMVDTTPTLKISSDDLPF